MGLNLMSIVVLATLQSSSVCYALKFRATFMHINVKGSPFRNNTASPEEIHEMDWSISRQRAEHLYRISLPTASEALRSGTEIIKSSFIMNFQIGNPRIDLYGYLDGVSSLCWVKCKTCEDCNDDDQRGIKYDYHNSLTYTPVVWGDRMCGDYATGATIMYKDAQCNYAIRYNGGTESEGFLARDEFSLDGGFVLKNFVFGCSTDNKGKHFGPQALIGLARRRSSLVNQLGVSQFGYYVERKYEWATEMVGEIVFGDYEDEIIDPDTTIKLLPDDTLYHLALKSITVGGQMLTTTYEHRMVIDSGAIVSCLVEDIYKQMVFKIISVLGRPLAGDSICYTNINKSPKFVFTFERPKKGSPLLELELCPTNIWSDKGNKYCLQIDMCRFGLSVFGMYQQRGLKVGYDLKRDVVSIRETVKDTCDSHFYSRD